MTQKMSDEEIARRQAEYRAQHERAVAQIAEIRRQVAEKAKAQDDGVPQ